MQCTQCVKSITLLPPLCIDFLNKHISARSIGFESWRLFDHCLFFQHWDSIWNLYNPKLKQWFFSFMLFVSHKSINTLASMLEINTHSFSATVNSKQHRTNVNTSLSFCCLTSLKTTSNKNASTKLSGKGIVCKVAICSIYKLHICFPRKPLKCQTI